MANEKLTLLMLEQSAHCDWDWIQTFDSYYTTAYNGVGVHGILNDAIDLVTNTSGYTYVFCEVGFLQKYFDGNPPDLADWKQAIAAGTFQFSSGGFTSAENLTLHTEAFIRNYLIGRWWLKTNLNATASLRMWVPDDFGHDAQFPALLKALGYTGVGFWRIPVAGPDMPPTGQVRINGGTYTIGVSNDAPSEILAIRGVVDFLWKAADQTRVQVHWLMNSYSEGNTDLGTDFSNPDVSGLNDAVNSYMNFTPSGIGFVPIDNDFTLPYDNLPAALATFSDHGVTAKLSTFDDFMTQANVNLATLSSAEFIPHPYYSGCYGSHPLLKQLHYGITRTLLQAETAALILEIIGGSSDAQSQLQSAWMEMLPTTHHDYVTGTSPNSVYDVEQVPDAKQWLADALDVQSSIIGSVANAIDASAIVGTPFAVFNAIGYPTTGSFVEIPCDDPSQYNSSTIDNDTFVPVQVSMSGTLLTLVALPSMGYQTTWLSETGANLSTDVSITDNGNGSFTLKNSKLAAVITTAGITELYDLISGSGNLFPNAPGNALVYYNDTGGLYRFANEVPWYDTTMQFNQATSTPDLTISQVEGGPVRVTVQVTGTVKVNNEAPVALTILYSLVPDEPFLRIVTTSAAPGNQFTTGYSVMVSFPFSPYGTMKELAYGTTSHWDRTAPRPWYTWQPGPPADIDFMTFEPAHEFVVPYENDSVGAIYHSSSPAWAISPDATSVYGCILRNTPGNVNAASGWDTGTYSISYAVRIPSGLTEPGDGLRNTSPLVEALLLNNPPAVSDPLTSPPNAPLGTMMSLATTVDTNAMVMAAKMGTMDPSQLIIRVYQPSNTTAQTTVELDPRLAESFVLPNTAVVTALEDAPADNVVINNFNSNSLTITMDNAYATLAIPSS